MTYSSRLYRSESGFVIGLMTEETYKRYMEASPGSSQNKIGPIFMFAPRVHLDNEPERLPWYAGDTDLMKRLIGDREVVEVNFALPFLNGIPRTSSEIISAMRRIGSVSEAMEAFDLKLGKQLTTA